MTESGDSPDFIDNVRKRDAAEAARQRAIAAPQRPHRATKTPDKGGHAHQALTNEYRAVADASKGTRNDTLNTACFNLGQLVAAGSLDYDAVVRELTDAALQSGLTAAELKSWDLPARAVKAGMKTPRDLSNVGSNMARQDSTAQTSQPGSDDSPRAKTGVPRGWVNGKQNGEEFEEYSLRLKKLSTIKSIVPQWVWTYNNVGRIQHGTLTMFAGRPGTGKSTAARWFAARLSKGELEGVWHGTPMRVGLYMAEEQTDALVIPGLIAAGANLDNVFEPRVTLGDNETSLMSVRDEHRLTDELCDNNIRALIIDPVMSIFDKNVDIYRNNDVRHFLDPLTRIAAAINGIVICVTHLRKGQVHDVMDALNGSSAFSEVPRAVFGFASIEGGEHVMQQAKNSAGPNDLKLSYHLPVEYVQTDDGQSIDLPRFEIKGETEVSISDIGGDSDDKDATTASADVDWLRQYLLIEQPAASSQVKQDARQQADISESRLHRARKRLRVRIINDPRPNKPHQTSWRLPSEDE